MEKSTKIKIAGIAALALALAIALGAAGAIAASRALDSNEDEQAVIDDAADRLGVEPGELSEALTEALESRIDDAVEDGRLSEEQGERLKEALESGAAPLFFGGWGKLEHRLGGLRVDSLETAASYLGVGEDALRERLREGETLAEVAEDEGKSVDGLVQALVDAGEARIDEAVDDGRLDEERADELKGELEERTRELVNGELDLVPGWSPWKGFKHGLGPHGPFGNGPPFGRGPSA
jgi:hypothetical protein